ncbi:cytochrome D1 domain-containing protein [Fonticella tunisiensis]|uniref:YVTN family beta-propeller protein n=1 Tax=Fonticella tunisiensis TaxID=1096341 RepID=A0A4R7KXG6_9CLOT|nr:cytochrome D1 domain-containing protein [Fonticella tunisiensis]TDT63646.1 YVTN family beta-propeller protein [Fonticella tunisiensis]
MIKERKPLISIIIGLTILSAVVVGLLNETWHFYRKKYYAFVPNAGDGTIAVIDTEKHEIVKRINIGTAASDGIAVTKNGKFIYAGNVEGGEVFVINTSTGEEVARIKTGLNVHGIDITPDDKYVYVTSGDLKEGVQYNYISIIETKSNKIVGQITSDWKSPSHIDFSKDGKLAYVSNVISNEVAIVDTQTREILKKIPVGRIPNETEPSVDGKRLYVANVGDGTLSIIDTNSYDIIGGIEAGRGIHGIAVTKDDKYVWTANRTSKDVSVIDVEKGKVVKSIKLGGTPNHVSIVPNTNISLCFKFGIRRYSGNRYVKL